MEKFTYDLLEQAIGKDVQVFEPDSEKQIAELKITKVTRPDKEDEEFESFSVLLSGKEEEHCGQGNYKLKSDAFGEVTLFMCPHAVDKYQIVISRKKSG
ncbi:hypothetical protein GCM10009092_15840 [Bowmanella denitrificans]|uniref:DUF6916 domain-containing protein n=1 Tax=Bowmanella denitrificans TaxID=366582 RepID=A0ABP3GUS3_9ALTE